MDQLMFKTVDFGDSQLRCSGCLGETKILVFKVIEHEDRTYYAFIQGEEESLFSPVKKALEGGPMIGELVFGNKIIVAIDPEITNLITEKYYLSLFGEIISSIVEPVGPGKMRFRRGPK